MVPSGRLPLAIRTVGLLDSVADRVANEMEHRIHHPLDQVLVDLGRLAFELERDLLARFAREVADDERHAPEDLADRDQADAHDPFPQRPQLAIDHHRVVVHRAPFSRGHVAFEAGE